MDLTFILGTALYEQDLYAADPYASFGGTAEVSLRTECMDVNIQKKKST